MQFTQGQEESMFPLATGKISYYQGYQEECSEGNYLSCGAKLTIDSRLFWLHLIKPESKDQKGQTLSKELTCITW